MPLTLTHAGRTTAAAPSPPPPSIPAPIAFYRFDSNGNDSSGNARNLTVNSGSLTAGLIGNALDAGDASLSFAGITSPTPPSFTIAFWWKPGAQQGSYIKVAQVELAGSSGEYVRVVASCARSNGNVACWAEWNENISGPVSTGRVRPIGSTWMLVAVTFDAATGFQTIYIDNVFAGLGSFADFSGIALGEWSVKSNVNAPNSSVDLVGVWDVVLDATQLTALYNAGAGYDPTP